MPCLLAAVVLASIGSTLAVGLVNDKSRVLVPLEGLAFVGLIPLAVLCIVELWPERSRHGAPPEANIKRV